MYSTAWYLYKAPLYTALRGAYVYTECTQHVVHLLYYKNKLTFMYFYTYDFTCGAQNWDLFTVYSTVIFSDRHPFGRNFLDGPCFPYVT